MRREEVEMNLAEFMRASFKASRYPVASGTLDQGQVCLGPTPWMDVLRLRRTGPTGQDTRRNASRHAQGSRATPKRGASRWGERVEHAWFALTLVVMGSLYLEALALLAQVA